MTHGRDCYRARPNDFSRADAARSAIEEALTGIAGVDRVDTTMDDGSIVITITVGADAETDAVTAILGRHPFKWDLKDPS